MEKRRIYSILNLLVLVGLIIWNYYSNTRAINESTIKEVSNIYDNLLTPASYAFSIWGLIYLALLSQAFYMIYIAFKEKEGSFISIAAPYLIAANIGNFIWVWFWLHQQLAFSVATMTVIFICLISVVIKLNMERWNAPFKTIAFVWWPIDLYAGWITLAAILNITSLLVSSGWQGGLSEISWSVIMIVIITIIYALMIIKRNMREFAMVGCWALIGIAVRHWDTIPILQWVSVICAIVLFIISSVHAYNNRHTLPISLSK